VAASGAAISSSLLVPGGLALLGAGLSLFYFNYGWMVQTPVVKARLVDVVMKTLHANSLTEDQQRAISDVTKIYKALSDMADKFAEMEKSSNGTGAFMTQECRNRLVCQTYSEFDGLLDLTRGAATLLKVPLKRLDQDLLLEYLIAADRGHHATSSGQACGALYGGCSMPEVSIKSTLRDMVGIEYEREAAGNTLEEGAVPPLSPGGVEPPV